MYHRISSFAAAVAAAGTLALAQPAAADLLDDIAERGTLVVGVKADYKPYGFLDPDGNIVGIEPDLAQDVADTLGVELELVPVVASNRMQFLEQGKIDLMIATMTDTDERRGVVNILDPDYYSSGTNIIARKTSGFETWEDLEGAPVCGLQGAFYNRKTEEEFGAEIVGFTGTSEALNALRQGRCAALVYDDSFLASRLQEAEWSDYAMPLETIDDAPWGVAVKQGETRFARFMSGMVVDWHVTGRIIELEESYGLTPVPFTKRMHEIFSGFVPAPK
ncbi:ABC transporter substrate-binding protein [Phormidium willei BDU 130791]|nr:ABC transporter substrate-binding protein [Phormidium willei BDU 130791]